MAEKKIVVVIGATGNQGGAVIRSLLRDGKWHVRGVTRDTKKEASHKLAQQGVEMVEGDLNDENSLVHAFTGAYAVFAVTNPWDPSCAGQEAQQGKNMVDAAKKAHVHHFVWSSLANADEISNGKYNVPHCASKVEVEKHLVASGLNYTVVALGFFYQNFVGMLPPRLQDGVVVFSLPMPTGSHLAGVDVTDVGDVVENVINHPDEWFGKWVPIFGSDIKVEDYASTFEHVTGRKAAYYPNNGDYGHDLNNMFAFFAEYNSPFGPHHHSKQASKAKSFEEWLKESGWTGPQ